MRVRKLENAAGFDMGAFTGGLRLRVGLIDADLLDGGTRFPNLALEKMAGWIRRAGHEVRLLCGAEDIEGDLLVDAAADLYDVLVCSQVFTKTRRHPVLEELRLDGRVMYGGTGFAEVGGPRLPDEVEHTRPDYHLYDEFIARQVGGRWQDYQQASVGFTTRGCFRQCPFCVNREYTRVVRWSPVAEFLDKSRPLIFLLDDNFMGAGHDVFHEVMNELEETGKRFQFRQGLDVRLMTREKAERLAAARWHGDYIFAYDDNSEATTKAVLRGLKVWRQVAPVARTKVYVLVGFDDPGVDGVLGMWERIARLMQMGCVPYIMRHEKVRESRYRSLYTQVARWCNQPAMFKRMSFEEFALAPDNFRAWVAADEARREIPLLKDFYKLKFEEKA